jgi:hypothetical protein
MPLGDVLERRNPSALRNRPVDHPQNPLVHPPHGSYGRLAFINVFQNLAKELLGIVAKGTLFLMILKPIEERAMRRNEFG